VTICSGLTPAPPPDAIVAGKPSFDLLSGCSVTGNDPGIADCPDTAAPAFERSGAFVSICYQSSMTEPSQRSSRIALAAGIAAALAMAIVGFVLGRSTTPPPLPPPHVVAPRSDPPPRLPVLTQPLGRGELLAAVVAASDAYAAGRAGVPANAELVGRRFEIRIPFGCYGPSPDGGGAPIRWSYDGEARALRISVSPEDWTEVPWVKAMGSGRMEAVEGFWLPRPWSSADACPPPEARMAVPPIFPAPRQTVGLAQFFETGGSRVPQRGGKPYRTVEKVAPDALRAEEGFRLVLSGRIAALPDGQPVGCHGDSAELRPVCLVAVEFDRVAIENPLSGELVAEWQA
jgi:hypothetical protein